jgi:hypothetical protein
MDISINFAFSILANFKTNPLFCFFMGYYVLHIWDILLKIT